MQTGGNRGEAAKLLTLGRTTLWRKMKEYNLA
jgi:transcriptional regulator of acetoin/glycerol metabolism